jgi:excisionase family DNA binding protein
MTKTKLLSVPEFARATGLPVTLARTLVKSGEVPSLRVGRRHRVSSCWIETWLSLANPKISAPETR